MERTRAHPLEEQARLEDELATLSAHINAATARWVELARAFREAGGAAGDDFGRWLAFRCGISGREAREVVRVAEALAELPAIRAAFARGELTLTKVRALTRVATPASEEGLLELACALTASQLERALRAFRRIAAEEARETHELEYVSYHFAEDGSLYLRARLASEDGTLVVKALEAARERVFARPARGAGGGRLCARLAGRATRGSPFGLREPARRGEACLALAVRSSLRACALVERGGARRACPERGLVSALRGQERGRARPPRRARRCGGPRDRARWPVRARARAGRLRRDRAPARL